MEQTGDVIAEAEAILHRLRSGFLDAFGDLETQLLKMISVEATPSSNAPTAALLAAFKKSAATCHIAKVNLPKRDDLARRIESYLQIRADVVHSRMEVRVFGGRCEARFVNSKNRLEKYAQSRNFTAEQLASVNEDVNMLVTELQQLNRVPSPASSPPPPSRDGAGGP